MNEQNPKVIALKDYQKPAYLIPQVELEFDLYDDFSVVKSKLFLAKNPDSTETNAPLVLKGENLLLKSIKLSGLELEKSDYDVSDEELTIFSVGSHTELEVTVEIKPHLNKALDGLYLSGNIFCTQNEPHGFRKITYFLDRPDVMSKYKTTVIADKTKYPVLLSNGNPIESKDLEGGRHCAVWEDPFPKPCYLFALVAGDLACIKSSFTTMSNREIDLRIYTDHGNEDKCDYAMVSLKNSMKWDEETFGLECDLDIYMIVAVDAFNMGAMENKGLNIFNSQYVLADPTTATDQNYQGIEGVIAHEYFHNWTGNRVTCRDWFQLTLKEGLTVFRDQEFSSDMNSRPVKRIDDVRILRDYQFAEDAGPNVHPIRPQSYMEVNNFYTSTVYNKGAEVIRMIETLIGKERFREGITKYFELYDGQAVTTEDFIHAMHLVSGMDFSKFEKWYAQAGTPSCDVQSEYDEQTKKYTLKFKQEKPQILKEQVCEPFLFPVKTGFVDATTGRAVALKLVGEKQSKEEHALIVSEKEQVFVFEEVQAKVTPSLLRDFSAPIQLNYEYSDDELSLLMAHDGNSFNRYEAGQRLARRSLNQMIQQHQKGEDIKSPAAFIDAFGSLLEKADQDPALTAESMILPSLNSLLAEMETCDFDAVHEAKETLLKSLAQKYQSELLELYYKYQDEGPYKVDAQSVGRRSLKNRVLSYLSVIEENDIIALISQQLEKATNMTDEIAALSALVQMDCPERDMAIEAFYQKWYHNPLVMNKWLSVQAFSKREDVLKQVQKLEQHKIFDMKNPNKVRSLIGCFSGNLIRFHHASGDGYRYVADKIIEINSFNPSIAARLATSFKLYTKLDEERKKKMAVELEKIMATEGLSRDVYEMVYNTLSSDKKKETSTK